MPFFSPKRKVSDAENKLRVLYCLDRLGMATQEQLWPFVAQLELMEYMPLCMFVDELLSDGAIEAGRYAMEGSLFLTAAGRRQLELFGNKLVHTDMERIAAAAPEYAQRLSQQRQVHAAYELAQDGEYRAHGAICESDVPTLHLQVRSRSTDEVERFVRLFPSVAAQIMAHLYLLPLSDTQRPLPDVCTQEQALTDAEHPALCAFGGREHAAVVSFGDETMHYTLLLLLPSDRMAWAWAQTAQERGAQLAKELRRLFEAQP